MLGFLEKIAAFSATPIHCSFEDLSCACGRIQQRHCLFSEGSIEIDCMLPHVKFEGGLSVSVLKNRQL
jgi:hypothetical protein